MFIKKIVSFAQNTAVVFYTSVVIIFIKPLEKSFRILYNSWCNQLADIIIYDQNI